MTEKGFVLGFQDLEIRAYKPIQKIWLTAARKSLESPDSSAEPYTVEKLITCGKLINTCWWLLKTFQQLLKILNSVDNVLIGC